MGSCAQGHADLPHLTKRSETEPRRRGTGSANEKGKVAVESGIGLSYGTICRKKRWKIHQSATEDIFLTCTPLDRVHVKKMRRPHAAAFR